jgi:hypothetical protein
MHRLQGFSCRRCFSSHWVLNSNRSRLGHHLSAKIGGLCVRRSFSGSPRKEGDVSGTFDLVKVQREFFEILDEFFRRATGKPYFKFASPMTFREKLHSNAGRIVSRGPKAFAWAADELAAFYNGPGTELFGAARQTAGTKLVVGGGSRFNPTQLDSVRKTLLYADTILVPDPILPAVVIFPSWEKSLEINDPQTQAGIEALQLSFFSHYLGHAFSSLSEVTSYARANESDFLAAVERQRLFVPPGAAGPVALADAVPEYLKEVARWRSPEHVSDVHKLPLPYQVLLLIFERLVPQYHLLENADELQAQPMLSIPAHWHYYSLCAEMYQDRLTREDLLSPQTVETLRALNQPGLQWLGNVPIDALVLK